jgi:hypothetical protein
MTADDVLPVPAALETQLSKCKTVRSSDYYKPRTKTPEVSASKHGRKSFVLAFAESHVGV